MGADQQVLRRLFGLSGQRRLCVLPARRDYYALKGRDEPFLEIQKARAIVGFQEH